MHLRFLLTLVVCLLVSSVAVADCTFSLLPEVTTAAGAKPGDVASGDFNHDGYDDLAIVNRQSSNVAILLGQPGGTFSAPTFAVTDGPSQHDVAAAYIDGDAHLDLLVMGGSATYGDVTYEGMYVEVLIGNGTGGFTLGDKEWIGYHPWDIAPGDFDSDGDTDFAVSRTGNNPASFHLIVNLGGGNIAQKSVNDMVNGPSGGSGIHSIAAGDFDGDGKLDVASADSSNSQVWIFFGLGDGTFTRSATPIVTTTETAHGAGFVAAGDFNGDGYDDISVANVITGSYFPGIATPTFVVTLSNGSNRTFGPVVSQGLVAAGAVEAMARDFDGDGLLDVLVGENSVINVFLGDGTGSFTSQTFPNGGTRVTTLDVDKDGGLDIAATHFGANTVGILRNACGQVSLDLVSTANPVSHGSNFTITASLTSNPAATGTLTLSRTGGGTLASTNLSAATTVSSTLSLEVGTYEFVATYSGDSRFPASTKTLIQTVQTAPFGPPPRFAATSAGATVQLTWFATSGTSKYEIWRNSGTGFTKIDETTNVFFTDSAAPATSALLYKVRSISPSSIASEFSNTDFTITHSFTDENILAGITTVKGAHLTEVRHAANALRALAGLPVATWNPSTVVLAAQFNEVRTAINEARGALGSTATTFTDTMTAGVRIKRIHMLELRAAMR